MVLVATMFFCVSSCSDDDSSQSPDFQTVILIMSVDFFVIIYCVQIQYVYNIHTNDKHK